MFLLQKRLIFVSGKGGVGKTTASICLGLLAARMKKKCLLVEIDTAGVVSSWFGKSAGALGRPVELLPGLFSMVVEGRAALQEYLQLILPAMVLKPIFASKVYDYFVAGAPGLQELMCMGKIFYEIDRAEKGVPSWDLIIVDAPSTGHGIEMYRMPQAAHDTFSVGLVHRETERILKLLRDPVTTAHVLVTLAEELPVSETLELAKMVQETLQFPLGALVVNRFYPEVLEQGLSGELQGLLQNQEGLSAFFLELANKTRIFQAEHEENVRQLQKLKSQLSQPMVVLPAFFKQHWTVDAFNTLSAHFEEQLP